LAKLVVTTYTHEHNPLKSPNLVGQWQHGFTHMANMMLGTDVTQNIEWAPSHELVMRPYMV
jgi:hypothetical protein